MGHDDRPLDEIVSADLRSLRMLGVAKQQVVHALRDVYNKAKEALGAEVNITPDVTAVYYESRGRIPSPFRGDGTFEKGEVVVRNIRSNQTLIVTSLSIHLIENHGFFQGQGARHRIDPKAVVELLNVKKDASCHLEAKHENPTESCV